jgi:hypothetical protein
MVAERFTTKSVRDRVVRGVLLGAKAFGLLATPFAVREAAAKVGVTSATDGDPLGKPPQEAEQSTGGPAGRNANVIGTFLSTPGNPANQQFGVVGFSGPNNYQGTGLFTGTK